MLWTSWTGGLVVVPYLSAFPAPPQDRGQLYECNVQRMIINLIKIRVLPISYSGEVLMMQSLTSDGSEAVSGGIQMKSQ